MPTSLFQWTYNQLQNRIVSHILFWVGIVAFFSGITSIFVEPWYREIIRKLCFLPAQIIAAYLLIYYQLPRLLFRKKYLWFAGSFLLTAYAMSVLARVLTVQFVEPVLYPELPRDPLGHILTDFTHLKYGYFKWIYDIPLIMLMVKYLKAHFTENHRIELLSKEKTETELNFLKAQVHPHFLFNTLNNLYTLTLDKSDQAPKVVEKLSDILDYMMHYCHQATVQIKKEVALIRDYIDLEMLRYGDRLDLVFDVEIDDPEIPIAPLILLSMVENAFKHGASGDIGRPKVHISLAASMDQIRFRVFNTKSRVVMPDPMNYKGGIGSENIRRQLQLIYPDRYSLEVQDKMDSYEVFLTIKLIRAATLEITG